MTSKLSIEAILSESERESSRYRWNGTFADYLRMVTQNPSQSRLSHSLVYDAIMSRGVKTGPTGEPVYGLFEEEIFGLEQHLDRIVQHFAALENSQVEITIEIRSEIPRGAPEKVVRTVNDNCRTLKFKSFGFEEE